MAWVRRNVPQLGFAWRLASYQLASATVNWVMWIWLADDGIITGAASGFGRLVAFDLAPKGHKRDRHAQVWPQVTELKDAVTAEGLDMRVEKLDVTSALDREIAFGWDIDVLVSNAGVQEAGPIAEQPMELLRAMSEVNFVAAVELLQRFAKRSSRSGPARSSSSRRSPGS